MSPLSSLAHLVVIAFVAGWAIFTATLRRILLGPTMRSWSWRTEWTVASGRAVLARASQYRDDPWLIRFGLTVQAPIPLDLRNEVSLRKVRIGGVRADRYLPSDPSSDATLLYFHGGGYVFGNPGTHRQFIARLVAATGAPAVAPTYRLAPKHRYPAAVDDAEAAYRSLLARGIDPSTIILAGDSAGGGLAIALLLRIRAQDLPMPAGAVVFSPYLDLLHRSYTIQANADTDYLPLTELTGPNVRYADADELTLPEVSPVEADLDGLPPLLVFAGGAEMILGDSLTLAEHAERDGVRCELVVERDMMHVWPALAPWEDATDRTLDAAAAWVASRMATTAD